MQARVEPQFLLNTLAQVRDLYRASVSQGERMLDELIAYLRAAMPKMRDTSSTVEQELDLVRAYLGIVSLRLGERLAFDVEVPGEVAHARMPPMMLLPLVDHAIVHGLAKPQATAVLRIRSRIADKKLRLEIADSGLGFAPGSEGEGIAGIRERLSALYDGDASLVLQQKKAYATEAVLEIRYEPSEALIDPAS
jgi:LytS/YehU family sensor histidine kinase